MAEYTLTFDHLDGDTRIRPLTISGDSPGELAQAVHRHARGYLGSRTVDIHLDEETLTGGILRAGRPVGEFTLVAGAEDCDEVGTWEPALDDLRHGFTLRDLEEMTRQAVRINLWYRGIDVDERYDEARFAIVQHLYTCDSVPRWGELVWVGAHAADKLTYGHGVSHGIRGGASSRNRGEMPSFHAYWNTATAPAIGFDERVVERIALWQILDTVSDHHRDVLNSLAAHGTYQAAATALGKNYLSYNAQISKARAAFRALWHEHETPSRMWGTDRRSNQSGDPLDGRRSRGTRALLRQRVTERSARAEATA